MLLAFQTGPHEALLPGYSRSDAISLGRALFFDRTLSADGRVSCADCHDPHRSFSDARDVSVGIHGYRGTRNAPDLRDALRYTSLFWDGREHALETVVLQPFTNTREMGLADLAALEQRVNAQPRYRRWTGVGHVPGRLDAQMIAHGLVQYLRSLPLPPTRYDRSLADPSVLDDDERAGLTLFAGKAACAECHLLTGTPALLTDQRFHHAGIGFEQVAGNVVAMLARMDAARTAQRSLGDLILAEQDIAGLGRFAITQRPVDLGAFRTPSLRNVARTAPYMHDGSVATLEQAVEREIYYRSLGQGRAVNLTVTEQRQLTAFLHALSTDDPPAAGL